MLLRCNVKAVDANYGALECITLLGEATQELIPEKVPGGSALALKGR